MEKYKEEDSNDEEFYTSFDPTTSQHGLRLSHKESSDSEGNEFHSDSQLTPQNSPAGVVSLKSPFYREQDSLESTDSASSNSTFDDNIEVNEGEPKDALELTSPSVRIARKKEFQNSILRRANKLLEVLDIRVRPIQSFAEVRKSASSIFVAVFEKIFSVRLKDIDRHPCHESDYIANAENVLESLSEALDFDLSFLDGRSICEGDIFQINELLSIFESLGEHVMSEEFDRDALAADITSASNRVEDSGVEEDPAKTIYEGYSQQRMKQKRLGSSKFERVQSTKNYSKAERESGARKLPLESEPIKSKRKSRKLKAPISKERLAAKRKTVKNCRSKTNQGTSEIRKKRVREKVSSRGVSLRSKAGHVQEKQISRKSTPMPYSKQEAWPHDQIALKIDADIERYSRAYSLIVKQLEAETRKRVLDARRDVAIKLRNKVRSARTMSVKLNRMKQLADDKAKSQMLARKNQEELFVRNLFRDALKLEQDYSIAQKRLVREERQKIDRLRLAQYESLKQNFLDRREMLRERIQEEKNQTKVLSNARRIALQDFERQLANRYEKKLKNIISSWESQDSRNRFKTEHKLRKHYESLQEKLRTKNL